MRLLSLFFILAGIALLAKGSIVAALAFVFAILALIGIRIFDNADNEWANDPQHANKPPATLALLEQTECECMALFYPAEIFKSEWELKLGNSNEDPS